MEQLSPSRWGLQHDMITLPKSVKRERLLENADVQDIDISKEDMAVLDGLDENLVTDWFVHIYLPRRTICPIANDFQGSH